ESLMFFLLPPCSPQQSDAATREESTASDSSADTRASMSRPPGFDYTFLRHYRHRSALFGCIPSSVDNTASPSETSDASGAALGNSAVVRHYQSRLGILSECGMVFK